MDSLEKLARLAQEYWFVPVSIPVLIAFGYALGKFAEKVSKDYEKMDEEMRDEYDSPDINDD